MTRARIDAVADVRLGYHFRGRVKEDLDGAARVLQVRDVHDGGDFDPSTLTRVAIPNASNHAAQPGDVIFLARGANRFAFAFDAVDAEPVVPASYFMVLAGKPEIIEPPFLAWAMNQPGFQAMVHARSSSSAIPQITKSDLIELTIDLPSLDTQRRVVAVNELMQREEAINTKIREHRIALLRAAARGAGG